MIDSSEAHVRFLIGGVQKGGTTALAHWLGRHPQVLLPASKEAHVFDAPDFDDDWSRAEINRRYARHYAEHARTRLVGDATPIYCLHERFVQRIARYNPDMRWILLLRDPVERAISQYHMERSRGDERWPLLPALALERWRLRAHLNDFSMRSPLRHHSYRLRGDYARQLDTVYRYFDRSQVLILRSDAFRTTPQAVLEGVCRHLGLSGSIDLPEGPSNALVFTGQYTPPSRRSPAWLLARWLLRTERREMCARYAGLID